MHVLAIGDIGVVDGMMHIGDEAMFEQFLDQARARGVTEVVAISSNPAETTERYRVASVGRMGLSGDRAAMLSRGRAIVRAAAGETGLLMPDDAAWPVIEAISHARLVVVTGAGNLASTWPVHIIERWVIAQVALRNDAPFVVSGQSLGPALTGEDAELLRELLVSARVVGVREPESFALADRLGVPPERLRQTVDDASFLAIEAPRHPEPSAAPPYCLVSLSTHVGAADRDRFLDATAALLDEIAEHTALEVRFLAHFAPLWGAPARGDIVMHDEVQRRMASPSQQVTTTTATDAAALAHGADLVVTSRYHPAVFAAAAGVPTLGIAVDDYTTVKLRGALGGFGQRTVASAEELIAGRALDLVGGIWADRAAIRRTAERISVGRRADSVAWWDRVLGTG